MDLSILARSQSIFTLPLSATKSASQSCGPATNRKILHCLRARSCWSWLIGDRLTPGKETSSTVQSATSRQYANQVQRHRRVKAALPMEPSVVERLWADGANKVCIGIFLSTNERRKDQGHLENLQDCLKALECEV